MTPAEMRKKIYGYKNSGKSCIDLKDAYDRGELRSSIARKKAMAIGKIINEKFESGEYLEMMKSEQFFYFSRNERKERDRLLGCFKKMMCFFETVTPDWISNYNNVERKRTNNMAAYIDENYSIDKIIQDAEQMPDGLYGNTKPEKIRDIRISALTMGYSNKIAHQCKFLRENYIHDYINYEMTNSDTLNNAIKNGKFGEISYDIKMYYLNYLRYKDEKGRNASGATLKSITDEMDLLKKELENLGIPQEASIYKKTTLRDLVMAERDGYDIKDIAMGDLVNQLRCQNDILYGVSRDDKGNEILVVDLPKYGQIIAHTNGNESIAKHRVPKYPYKAYDVDIGTVLYIQEGSPTMKYIINQAKNKPKMKSFIMKELMELDDKKEAHQIVVKLGYNKNALSQLHNAIDIKGEINDD